MCNNVRSREAKFVVKRTSKADLSWLGRAKSEQEQGVEVNFDQTKDKHRRRVRDMGHVTGEVTLTLMPTLLENQGSTARDHCMLERNFLSHARLGLFLLLLSSSVLL